MFIARLTPDGTALIYGTYLGGPQSDVLEDLVVDSNGFVTVCGWVTGNNVQVFVTTPNAFDRTWNGSQDAAIARLKLDGAGAADLKYATLIGGASQDNLWKAVIDPLNPELVTFPITTSAVSDVFGISLVGTINGVGGTGTVAVVPPGAPAPTNLIVLPGSVTGGTPATGVVTLNQFAPAGGTVVALSSTHRASRAFRRA